jgi:hypothetical protein
MACPTLLAQHHAKTIADAHQHVRRQRRKL